MIGLVRAAAEKISDELSLHKQGLDWEDQDGSIQRAAREVVKVVIGPQFTGILCHESPDWDWWLKLAPEVKGRAVTAFRQAVDSELMASYPGFYTSSTASITVQQHKDWLATIPEPIEPTA